MAADMTGNRVLDRGDRVAAQRVTGAVVRVYATSAPEDFRTSRVPALKLGFEGIAGDRHGGFTRRSSGREPWYPRGTEMCNERQISILSCEELAEVAAEMDLPEIEAGWIGANLLMEGIARLTRIPPRTRLVFAGGAVLRVDGDNAPCRIAGRAIAEQFPERDGLDLQFALAARGKRGLVGYVERPGVIRPGEEVTAHIPEHWLYRSD
ncbi:MOSC domain-containing protein [Stappia taiwanensis]|uniref:MOSC domain-containing protein n=1 Tax=Stappia taiwanensis TaxID=992267 RepID=A0A838XMU4_9HYPH|nr:MOSC domain-containing protein [Stappia taiwanensis]MBA4611137.1 MOSC domain-containing protein [Stappia taiwanensis]GGE86226.1 molybdenum cofactor sulfurase [Stappia taiwanensis]